jgi:hypothetical protein
MATSQRLSRGFHRLALFLAAITLLIGGSMSAFYAYQGLLLHQKLGRVPINPAT